MTTVKGVEGLHRCVETFLTIAKRVGGLRRCVGTALTTAKLRRVRFSISKAHRKVGQLQRELMSIDPGSTLLYENLLHPSMSLLGSTTPFHDSTRIYYTLP